MPKRYIPKSQLENKKEHTEYLKPVKQYKPKKKKEKPFIYYRAIAIRRFGLNKYGNRGWKGLAQAICMIKEGFKPTFKSKNDAIRYVKSILG